MVLLQRLWLQDFRCYEELDVEPGSGVTLVVGANGQGKTSLLEAVSWLAAGRSFRGVPDSALVRTSASAAIIRAAVTRAGHDRTVEVEIAPGGRTRIQVNGTRVPRLRALAETVTTTVFSPDDLQLIKGGPALRREYLDDLLGVLAPRYDAACRDLERILKQRNALLRGGVRSADDRTTLEVWDAQLARVSGVIVDGRFRLLERLGSPLSESYRALAGTTDQTRTNDAYGVYVSDWVAASTGQAPSGAERIERLGTDLLGALERLRSKELVRETTLAGPHRDEWDLFVNELPARTHASQGEQRSLALALRLAGHGTVVEVTGEAPLLLLDDVFSELDPGRTAALVTNLPKAQAIVTTAGLLPEGLRADAIVRIHDGRLVSS